ncbi:MAG: TetR family transcriptional regulator [Sphaerisporangium sp.]|nr:TetR family transcriptional regulator [Sphaerisporangium sp.]
METELAALPPTDDAAESATGAGGLTAFQLLGTALEDLAVLLIDGPLRGLLPVQALEAEQRLMDSIERGI